MLLTYIFTNQVQAHFKMTENWTHFKMTENWTHFKMTEQKPKKFEPDIFSHYSIRKWRKH